MDVPASDEYLFTSYSSTIGGNGLLQGILYSFQTKKIENIRNLINDIDDVPFFFIPKKLSNGKAYLTIDALEIVDHFSGNEKQEENQSRKV